MAIILIIVSLLSFSIGVLIMANPARMWELEKFLRAYPDYPMPDDWHSTNRGRGVAFIAFGLLLVFIIPVFT